MLSRRRSRKLIDYEVQSSLVIRLCLHWALFLVATAIAMFFWIRLFETPVDDFQATLGRFLSTFVPLLIVSLALVPVFIYDSVKISNRFTGPIFRLRQTLSSLANGQAARPLEFRSGDFWRSLADDFNRVVKLPKADVETSSSPNVDPS